MPRHIPRIAALILIAALAVTVSACGQDTGESQAGSEFPFGSPGEASDADRVIEIVANDSLAFVPDEITVSVGKTVTFRLINEGNLDHDFTLGDEATQDEHEAEMEDMAGMAHDEPNVATIPGGETAELTWTFGEEGTVLVGCHKPGHYDAGMTASITVES